MTSAVQKGVSLQACWMLAWADTTCNCCCCCVPMYCCPCRDDLLTLAYAVGMGGLVATSVFIFDVSIQYVHDLPDIFAQVGSLCRGLRRSVCADKQLQGKTQFLPVRAAENCSRDRKLLEGQLRWEAK